MSTPALQQLAALHRSMYERAMAEARELLGNESKSIATYSKEFEKSLPDSFKRVLAKRISQAIDNHKVVLFGDFHSHKQCQRALLRVMRTYNNTPDHAPMVLVLEMFRAKDQNALTQWADGLIDDEKLLELTQYEIIWGFPWQNYKPLLEFCRSNGIPLIAGNTDSAGKDNLRDRDIFAADIIRQAVKDHPSSKVFYIVGEYHLADSQLPLIFEQAPDKLPFMRLIANTDKYFFMLPTDRIHRSDEFLELTASFYCIINSPPWIKWQSQTLMDELKRIGSSTFLTSEIADEDFQEEDSDSDPEDDEYFTEDIMDIDSHLRHTMTHLTSYLGIKYDSQLLESFRIVTSLSEDDLDHMPSAAKVAFLERSARDGLATDFQRRLVYLNDVSANNLSFIAGHIIFGSNSGLTENYLTPQDLLVSEILKYTLAYLANKILNPRIILHSRKVVEDYIDATKGKRIHGLSKLRRDIARGSMKFFNWYGQISTSHRVLKVSREIPTDLIELDVRSSNDLSRRIAQIIVSAVYQKLISGRLDTADIQRFFTKKCNSKTKAKKLLDELVDFV